MPDSFFQRTFLKTEFQKLIELTSSFFFEIFKGDHTNWWKILLFIYLSFAAGSSITLSWPDIQSSFKGLLVIIVLFLVFNFATVWIGNFAMVWAGNLAKFLSGFYSLMLLTFIINLAFSLILLIGWIGKILLREEK
jgi:hypothetical protein